MQYNTKMILYHNKNCSKSRECLNILKNQDIKFEIRDYMKNKLSIEEVTHIIENLNSSIETLIRDKKLFNTEECKRIKKNCVCIYLKTQKTCKDQFFMTEKTILYVDPQK